MRTAVPSLVAAAAVAGALAPAALAADRTLVGTFPIGTRGDYAVTTSASTFVVMASNSSYLLSLIDTRTFDEVGELRLGISSARTRSLTGTQLATGSVIAGTDDGYLERFALSDLKSYANGGTEPLSDFLEVDADDDAVRAVAVEASGQRVYAGISQDENVRVFNVQTDVDLGTLALGHEPLTALAVTTGFAERVYFGCDDGFLAWVDTGAGTPAAVQVDATGTHDFTDLASVVVGADTRLVVLDADDDTLLVYSAGGPTLVDSLGLGGNAVAIATSGTGTTARIWVAFDDATGGFRVEAFDASTLAAAQAAIALPAAPVSLVEAGGWLFAGLASSQVSVITDRPWVEILGVTPSPIPEADSDVQVTFRPDRTGSATVFLNGDELETVSVTADDTVTVTLPGADVADSVQEGPNRVRVQLAADALTGHDEQVVIFDEAPNSPRNFEVGFGNNRVIARWDEPTGGDTAHYVVYFGLAITDTSGTAAQPSPAEVNGHQYVVNVTNGTTVFMSVAAVDSSGQFSARTSVKSATAQPTVGAADLAGEDGGFLCSVASGAVTGAGPRVRATLGALAALGVAILALRRSFR